MNVLSRNGTFTVQHSAKMVKNTHTNTHLLSQFSREDSQLSFERLLSAADSDVPVPRAKPSSAGEQPQQLRRELAKAKKTIRDVTELLRECEEAGVRLREQAKLLKEEIRRLERNREREEGVSNMEYLKNVVLKVRVSV